MGQEDPTLRPHFRQKLCTSSNENVVIILKYPPNLFRVIRTISRRSNIFTLTD